MARTSASQLAAMQQSGMQSAQNMPAASARIASGLSSTPSLFAAPSQKLPGTQPTIAAPSQKLTSATSTGYNTALTASPSAKLSIAQPGAQRPSVLTTPSGQSALTAATNAVVGAAQNAAGNAIAAASPTGAAPGANSYPLKDVIKATGATASQALPAPATLDTVLGSSPLTQAQWNSSQALGQGIQQQGQNVLAGQQQTANTFNRAGQGFDATSQSVAARPTGFIDPRTGQPGMTPGFNVGAQVPTTGGTRAPAALSTSQLGGVPQAAGVGGIAGQLGGAPGAVNPNSLGAVSQVAGNLGGGYQVGNVGGIAGRLGAGPSVGDVGNIQMQGGPGAVMPQLGSMGASNAAQQGMLGRLEGFLDSPEGPSVAEAQLKQAQAGNMADLIGAARSGRGGAGASAQALRGAMSEGSALMSDTAGQLATLRAQEADMQRNRQLSALGLGGQMAEAQRAGDLSFRGQDLAALQGDQGAALQGRGQDLQAAMANQGTQTALEQLRANTALGARGQDLSALQGDQSTALGLEGLRANTATTTRAQDLGALTADQQASIAARGQNLGALQGNQQTALGARGQNLSALQGDQATQAQMSLGQLQANLAGRGQDLSLLQGNQATALGARGQDVTRDLGMANVNLGMRGQDAGVLMSDADRNLAAQRLNLDAGLGYGGLANDATGQGLQFLQGANQQGVMSQGLANDAAQNYMNNITSINNANTMADAGIRQQIVQNQGQPSFGESMAIAGFQSLPQMLGPLATILSDERTKTDISPLDSLAEHLRAAPGYRYRYKDGFGEDTSHEHAGPMAQDLERSPFGKTLVKRGPDGLRRVDTNRLTLVNHAALAGMRSELDRLKAALEG